MKRGLWIGIGVGAVLLIVFFLILGRNRNVAPTKSTITVWSPFDEGKIFQAISQKFLAANPTVTLDFKYVQAADAKDYEAQAINAIANGKGPDIWMVRSDWIPKNIDKSTPATVKGSTAAAIAQVKQSIAPNLVDLNTVDGKLYGLPFSGDALAIIYNQTLYGQLTNQMTGDQAKLAQTVPASWADLKAQAALISQSRNSLVTRSAIALGTASNTLAPSDTLSAFLVEGGVTNVLAADGKSVVFNLPQVSLGTTKLPATDALGFYTSFATPGQPNFSWSENLGDPVQAFLNQKTVAIIGYYSTLRTILAKSPSFSITLDPLVQPDPTPTSTRVDYGVTWSGVVNKTSPHSLLAWQYLGYLSNQGLLSQYATQAGRLSVVGNSDGSPRASLYESGDAPTLFSDELPTIRQLSAPEWQFRDQVLQDTINLVIDSGQTAQTAIDTAASRFKAQFLATP